jgi:hypothetical protein
MAFIPVPNTVALTMVHEFLAQRLTNTLYLAYDRPITPFDLGDLVNDVIPLWSQQIMPRLSNQTRLVTISAKDLTAQNGLSFEYSGAPLPVAGGAAGPPLPSSVSIVLSLRTGRAGRSYRGRLYFGGFSEAQSDGNFFFNDLPTQLQNALSNVIAGLNNSTRTVVVVSRFFQNAARTVGLTTPVTAVVARTKRAATQRRRLPEN